MKKWYRSPVTKLLLVLTACASAVGLVISFVMLLCMGIIGQYMAKTYLETKKRPLYLVEEEKLEG